MKNVLQKMERIILLFLCISMVPGCGDSDSVSILKNQETAEEFTVSQEKAMEEEVGSELQDESDIQNEAENYSVDETESQMIYVDVCGAVKTPGVYELPQGSRVFQAIEKAGGFLEEAQQSLINQAEFLTDGQQIRIYTKEEAEELKSTAVDETAAKGLSSQDENTSSGQNTDEKININRADKSMLMTLSGIGETRAEAIIAYREKTGGFSTIEELMQVEGIKEKTYEKLKDKITVQ
ncbi:MAG: helix-hairpin-helix domain-containing protein [Oliverpabstia sp.]